MTTEEQKIAIAEACGWRKGAGGDDWWRESDKVIYCDSDIPNYPTDLNAMHEAEKTLTAQQLDALNCFLDFVMDRAPRRFDQMAWAAHRETVTAAQRAEAFLRTDRQMALTKSFK